MKDLSLTTPERVRPRRLRRTPALRDLVAETRVTAAELIMPHFVLPVAKADVPISSMPGISLHGLDNLVAQVEQDLELGIRAVLLFGHPEEGTKTPTGAAAASRNGAVQRAVEELKRRHGDALIVMTDVCLCAYTSHGHCGVLRDGRIDNDASLEPLVEAALSHARAGADVVAPSDMMDGRVAAIRTALDGAGFQDVQIMAYAAKYASAFYGPFRDAIGTNATLVGDKRTYQMDPANSDEAMREIAMDIEEGADMIMVKPGLPYLDIVRRAKDTFGMPTFAYQVSGEYAMIEAAAARGWIARRSAVTESVLSIRRAGADAILTYWATELAGWLAEEQ